MRTECGKYYQMLQQEIDQFKQISYTVMQQQKIRRMSIGGEMKNWKHNLWMYSLNFWSPWRSIFRNWKRRFLIKRFYNHIISFKNETQMNKTTLAKYVWISNQKHNKTPTLKWYIIKYAPSYSNITKSCMLCLHEKFEILTFLNEPLNKRSELASKCRHFNKHLMPNYRANDWHSVWYLSHNSII